MIWRNIERLISFMRCPEAIQTALSASALSVRAAMPLVVFSFLSCSSDLENRLRAYEDAHNRHDVDAALSYLTDDIRFEMVGDWVREGKEELREYEEWDAAIGSHFAFRNIRVGGDTIICKLTERNDWFRLIGIEAIDYEWAKIRFRNGSIREIVAQQTRESVNATRRRFESFVQWASEERTYELVELMRGIEFLFNKENAGDWLTLLQEWRVATTYPTRSHYSIDCQIEPEGGSIEGTETIRIVNENSKPIERLAVNWSLSGRETMEIFAGGKKIRIPKENGNGTHGVPTFFDLPEQLAGGDSTELHLRFSGRLPAARDPARLSLIRWHPRLFWGFPTQDDFDVRIEVPQEYTVVTTGLRDSASDHYRADNVRSFGLFLGKGMRLLESKAGEVVVRCPYTTQSEDCARLLVATAVDAIEFYRARFGFYPHTTLAIMPGMEYPAGSRPFATGMVEIHGQERMDERSDLHWQWVVAHEIGHQYFGEHVLDQGLEGWSWLMVGLGLYADREYVRAKGLGLERHRSIMAQYINGVRRFFDTRADRTQSEIAEVEFDYNNVVVRGKGFSIISALASVLGPNAFDSIHVRCLRELAGKRLGVRQFRSMCEEAVQEDLGWFFNQWVHSSRYLSYEVASQECKKIGDRYASEVEVRCIGTLRMPVPVAMHFEDGTVHRTKTDRFLDRNHLYFESAAPLTRVMLDPDNELALVIPPPSVEGAVLGRALDQMEYTGTGDLAADLYEKAVEIPLADGMLWQKLGVILFDGEYYQEALGAFQQAAKYLENEGSPYTFISYVWQGHILDILGDRQAAVQRYEEALRRDTRRTFEYSQYGMKINRRWVEERLKRPFRRL